MALVSLVLTSLLLPPALAAPDICDAFGPATESQDLLSGDVTIRGTERNAFLGRAVVRAGDLNGDGHEDLALGIPGDGDQGPSAGAVAVFLGPFDAGDLDPASADLIAYGVPYARAGFTLAPAGDVDADGYDDLLVGSAPTRRAADDRARVWLVRGRPHFAGQLDLASQADAAFVGEPGDAFGASLASAGDTDGDGLDDIVIGAPASQGRAGAAYLFRGPFLGGYDVTDADVAYTSTAASARVGTAVAGVGDLDDDGFADIAIGAPHDATQGTHAGAAHIVYGDPFAWGEEILEEVAEATLYGSLYDKVGASLSAAGDTNEDGYVDLWIGAKQWGSTQRGAVFLVRGGALPWGTARLTDAQEVILRGVDAGDLFGSAIAGDVDLDGDGHLDVVIGAERADGAVLQTGGAWAMLGPFTSDRTADPASGRYAGPHARAYAGASVAAFHDLNGDGYGDFVASAWRAETSHRGGGAVSVFFGGADTADAVSWYLDSDDDGWGDEDHATVACAPPADHVARAGDCDDSDPAFHPQALETDCADPLDYNCDGSVGAVDGDGDGVDACAGDCDDGDALIGPHVVEVCFDDLDNDCDGAADDAQAVDATTWYPDGDQDGFGHRTLGVTACEVPPFFLAEPVTVGGDCDDQDATIWPGAAEWCDTVDNDCDDDIDEADAIDAAPWFLDLDGDTHGDPTTRVYACTQPLDHVASARDCDDADALVTPGATEVCNGLDDDCDGMDYLGGPVPLTHAQLALRSTTTGDGLGSAVLLVPDMDADGHAEVVLAAPGDDALAPDAGAVYLRDGDHDGGAFDVSEVRADGSTRWDARIRTPARQAALGSAMATGDFNGDGVADLALGAPGTSQGSRGRGAVLIYLGPVRGDLDDLDADVTLYGGASGDAAGTCLSAHDLDGDGTDDLVIGAPGYARDGESQGAGFVVYGHDLASGTVDTAAAAVLEGQPGDRLGSRCAMAGDLDQDGHPDVLIAAPDADGSRGRVDLVRGTSARHSGLLTAAISLTGTDLATRLGAALAAGSDVDGDGHPDAVLGTTANEAYLLRGGSLPPNGPVEAASSTTFVGGFADQIGTTLALVGDVDGDGVGDLAFGAVGDDTGGDSAGAVALVYGIAAFPPVVDLATLESRGRDVGGITHDHADLGTTHGARLQGQHTGGHLGAAISGGQDVDGDGRPDLLLGAPGHTVGRAFVRSAGPYGRDVGTDAAFLASQTTHYVDQDADGQADDHRTAFDSCPFHVAVDHTGPFAPARRATTDPATATDCDDNDPTVYVGASERDLDGIDADCDGFDSANRLPHLIVRLGPEDPHTDSVLQAQVTVIDPDAGTMDETPITLRYAWLVNGSPTGTSGSTLDGTVWFARDDIVTVRVSADDTRDVTGTFEWSIPIVNGVPQLTDLAIDPAVPTMTDTVSVTWTHIDPDVDDPADVDCEWSVQWFDSLGHERWNDLQAQHTEIMGQCDSIRNCEHGRLMRARCRVWDGQVWSGWAVSPEFIIHPDSPDTDPPTANTPPTAPGILVTPAAPTTDDTLVCDIVTPSTDADGDPITYAVTWTVNGSPFSGPTDTSVHPGDTIAQGDLVAADWTCTVTPHDGTDPGPTATATTTVVPEPNTPPTAPSVQITPAAPTTDDALVCDIVVPSTDADGDPITYAFAWTVDGSPFPGTPGTHTHAGDTIDSPDVTAADWVCTVNPHDGTDAGPSASDAATVVAPDDLRDKGRRRLVSGDDASCMRTTLGDVVCWGEGTAGKLGRGSIEDIGDESGEMEDHLIPVMVGTAGVPITLDIGEDYGCAVFDDGAMKCWGKNASGQLGLGHASDLGNVPGELGDNLPFVDVGTGRTVEQVSANATHTCVRLDDASMKCWGSGSRGQLGHEDWDALGDQDGEMGDALLPIDLGTGRTAVDITTGSDFTCALLDDDSVKCWGLNNHGQLGQGHTTELGDDPGEMGDALPAIDLGDHATVVDIEAGDRTVCARFDDGSLKCWGGNAYGQAGQGHADHIGDEAGEMGNALPTIDLGTGRTAVSMGVGLDFTCVLLDDASVKCFGRAHLGQIGSGGDDPLGDDAGEMGDALLPVDLSSHLIPDGLAVGYTHACVSFTCGQIKCWGGNVKGELGQADIVSRGDDPHEMGDLLPVVPLGSFVLAEHASPPATCPYSEGVTVDGDDSDWPADAIFATSSGGTTATMLTWDDTFIYLGIRHPDVATLDNDHHVFAYFGNGDDDTGAFSAMRSGVRISPQQPSLPFWSQAAVQWRTDDADDAYFYADTFLGNTTWEDEGFYFSIWETSDALRATNGTDVLELRIHREALHLSDVMWAHVAWLDDTPGIENGFGATPVSSFAEGASDPAYTSFYAFDLTDPAGPAAATELPAVP